MGVIEHWGNYMCRKNRVPWYRERHRVSSSRKGSVGSLCWGASNPLIWHFTLFWLVFCGSCELIFPLSNKSQDLIMIASLAWTHSANLDRWDELLAPSHLSRRHYLLTLPCFLPSEVLPLGGRGWRIKWPEPWLEHLSQDNLGILDTEFTGLELLQNQNLSSGWRCQQYSARWSTFYSLIQVLGTCLKLMICPHRLFNNRYHIPGK